ncbi:MAG: CoA transferase, partial [Alphaproteobacteria bacterium]|nr:CoA transferase [Alphaproteobacteria bacterium]
MTRGTGALDGVVVIERAGRLAGAVCGTALAELGATVIRADVPGLPRPPEPAAWRTHPLALAGKQLLVLSADPAAAEEQWRDLLARADAVIMSPPLPPIDDMPPDLIRCDISAFGHDGADGLPDDCGEAILQAIGGMMSTTGEEDGAPDFIGAPLVELYTGLNGVAAILAALRVRDAGGPAQRIDLAAFDTSVALIGAFIGHVQVGRGHGLRAGSRHPLCSPWNAYPTRDGWVLVCVSTEPQWARVTELLGQPALKEDERFATMAGRKSQQDIVDALVSGWTATRTTAEAAAAFESAGIPAGPILTVPDLLASADPPPTHDVTAESRTYRVPESLFVMSRSPAKVAETIAVPSSDIDGALAALEPRQAVAATAPAKLPLEGVRVVEVTVFTAGPLGG